LHGLLVPQCFIQRESVDPVTIAKTFTEPAWQTNQTVFGLSIVMQSLEGCPYTNGEFQLGEKKNLETSLALIGRQPKRRGNEESRNLDNRHKWNSTKYL
jgi:hypothetical protein